MPLQVAHLDGSQAVTIGDEDHGSVAVAVAAVLAGAVHQALDLALGEVGGASLSSLQWLTARRRLLVSSVKVPLLQSCCPFIGRMTARPHPGHEPTYRGINRQGWNKTALGNNRRTSPASPNSRARRRARAHNPRAAGATQMRHSSLGRAGAGCAPFFAASGKSRQTAGVPLSPLALSTLWSLHRQVRLALNWTDPARSQPEKRARRYWWNLGAGGERNRSSYRSAIGSGLVTGHLHNYSACARDRSEHDERESEPHLVAQVGPQTKITKLGMDGVRRRHGKLPQAPQL